MSLSNLIHYLVLPPTNLLLVALVGLALRRCWPRTGLLLRRGALALLLLISTRLVANLLVAPLETTPPLTFEAARGAQAIVVLTAGFSPRAPEYNGDDAPDSIALPRMRYAAKVQHDTGLPLLVTGGRINSRQAQSLAASMAAGLRNEFRTEVKWVEEASTNTAENASGSAAILLPAGIRRIVLVTHAAHMERAARVFSKAGFEVVPAPTAYYSRIPFDPAQLMPSASAFVISYYAIYEWIGLAWYRARH